MSYRLGYIEWADSLFREAIPLLSGDLRALMDDPLSLLRTPVKSDSATEAAGGSADTLRSSDSAAVVEHAPIPFAALPFPAPPGDPGAASLAELDPDPTTPQNEVQLEVWSRIAHAYLLLADPRRPGLDARAETYIRYGPPASVQFNPPGVPLFFQSNPLHPGVRHEFPLDAELWLYPELGMHILLHDRSLVGQYTQAWTRNYDPGTTPDPGILAHRPDLIALGGGRGVISTLPPAGQRLEVRGAVAAFESESGPRVLVQARAPAAPADTLIARWVAHDAAGRAVARGEETPAISACDPAELRIAEFATGLPPGRYDIAVSVHDSHQRRGLFRTSVALARAGVAIGLSDLVLCCGDPSQLADAGAVRVETDMDAIVRGRRPLIVYFEIYRLAPGPEGTSRFRYEYEVKRVAADRSPTAIRDADRSPPVDRWVSRDETNLGRMRRQFIRVQTGSLAEGRYQVRVRDLVADAEAEQVVEFARE